MKHSGSEIRRVMICNEPKNLIYVFVYEIMILIDLIKSIYTTINKNSLRI
jgi:hypothetical protein